MPMIESYSVLLKQIRLAYDATLEPSDYFLEASLVR
jgi:hypothetical protein